MLICKHEGGFILVKCDEDVSQELYTRTEECKYLVGAQRYRFLMAMGTMLLMMGVVLVDNTKFKAQAIISTDYILLNGAYWLLGLTTKKDFWDVSRYTWVETNITDVRNADE